MSIGNHPDDQQLDAMFRAWAEDIRSNTRTAALTADPKRLASRSLVLSLSAVLLVTAVAVGVMALRLTHTHSTTASGSAVKSPTDVIVGSGDARNYVLRSGDTAIGTGEVLALPGRPVRFCAPRAFAFTGGRGDPNFSYCAVGVDVRGVDLNDLADRHAHGKAVYGYAQLTGVYQRGALAVSRQLAAPPKPSTTPDNPPCPTPANGWGAGQPAMNAAERYKRSHRGSIVMLAYLNPTRHQSLVYVLAAGDPTPVRQALAGAYGRKLCVTRSRYTVAQVAAASRLMRSIITNNHSQTLTALSEAGGLGLAADEQPSTPASVPILSEHLARIIDAQPVGLIQLKVWLTPMR